MSDPREAIISRLVDVIAETLGFENVSRNQLYGDDADENPAPQVSVLEGDETPAAEQMPNNIPASAAQLIHMQPQVLLSNFDTSADVGTGLSASRAAIIKAVVADSTLNGLTHKNTGGRYVGMESDLAFARDALGRMALKFQFTYVLLPSQL